MPLKMPDMKTWLNCSMCSKAALCQGVGHGMGPIRDEHLQEWYAGRIGELVVLGCPGAHAERVHQLAAADAVESIRSQQDVGPAHWSCGVALIAAERTRQVTTEGYSADHDDEHGDGELARAGACYATPREYRDYRPRGHVSQPVVPRLWPFDAQSWKGLDALPHGPGGRLRELAKAGALIAAEMDRLIRGGE